MRAAELLFEYEVDTFVTLPRRPLTDDEKDILQDFQKVLVLLKDFFDGDRSREDFNNLASALTRFDNKPFMARVKKWMNDVRKHHHEIDKAKPQVDTTKQHLDSIVKEGFKAFQEKNISKIIAVGKKAEQINRTFEKAFADPKRYYSNKKVDHPLYIQDPLFFQTNDFLRRFEENEMDNVIAIDPNAVFTYMDMPMDENFQYLAYWAMELSKKNEPAQLNQHQYNKWIRLQYKDDPDFNELLKLVDRYLSSNIKDNVVKILQKLKKFPILVKTHEKLRRNIDRVYRGVPETDVKYVLNREREKKFVATSTSRHAAENFALSKGHLEQKGRTDGVVIIYDVTPNDIIFDTRLFGSIFGESEVLINASTAKVNDVYFIDPE